MNKYHKVNWKGLHRCCAIALNNSNPGIMWSPEKGDTVTCGTCKAPIMWKGIQWEWATKEECIEYNPHFVW